MRHLLLIAGIVVVALSAALVSLGPTAWSGSQGRPSPQPSGPALAAAERARAELAARLGVAAERITVESAEEHTWSDASLGLPEPGMMYAQVLTEGHIVTLSHGGKTYVYHVAGETVKLNPSSD